MVEGEREEEKKKKVFRNHETFDGMPRDGVARRSRITIIELHRTRGSSRLLKERKKIARKLLSRGNEMVSGERGGSLCVTRARKGWLRRRWFERRRGEGGHAVGKSIEAFVRRVQLSD